jgi:hypothetical protein
MRRVIVLHDMWQQQQQQHLPLVCMCLLVMCVRGVLNRRRCLSERQGCLVSLSDGSGDVLH